MLTAVFLVSQAVDTGGNGGVVTVYYVIGCIVAVLGLMEGGRRLYGRQKQRWTTEGEIRAHSAQIMEENSKQLTENTAAIALLTKQLTEFMATSRAELNGLGGRVHRLERVRVNGDEDPGT